MIMIMIMIKSTIMSLNENSLKLVPFALQERAASSWNPSSMSGNGRARAESTTR